MSIAYFSWHLSQGLDKPVVDHTGLAGYYDYAIDSPATMEFHNGDKLIPGEEPGFVLKAREQVEQLGLRLESARKVTLEVFVIDHVERPKAN